MGKKLQFLFLFTFIATHGQVKKTNATFEAAALSMAAPYENVHLHLNKTTLAKGENLWFTAYVQDQLTAAPSKETTNLHVAIYNTEAKEVKRKLLYVENGVATGHFAIDSAFTGKEYLILSWTGHMQNIKALKPYAQEIRIADFLGGTKTEKTDSISLQVYPEGGELVAEAFNNVGLYSVANGMGIPLKSIELVDDEGTSIVKGIATNKEGFGKVGFVPAPNKRYYLRHLGFDNKPLKTVLPVADKTAVGLSVDNLTQDQIVFKLVASKEMLKEKKAQTYVLAIYKNNNVLLEDWEIDGRELAIAVNRNLVSYGINTAVLFDTAMRPIARRMFYNYRASNTRILDVTTEYCKNTSGDSLQIDFELPTNDNPPVSLSVSVLPKGSLAYNPNQSLLSAFLIAPYVNNLKALYNYPNDTNKQMQYALDMRLLVEGWGSYSWTSRIPQTDGVLAPLESGIEVTGKVVDADLTIEKQVYLQTAIAKEMVIEPLASDKSFRANMLLYDGDSLGISLIGKKGKLRLPKVRFANIEKPPAPSTYNPRGFFGVPNSKEMRSSSSDEEIETFTQDSRTIALEEVVVTDRAIQNNKILLNSAAVEGRRITDEDIKRYTTIRTYLRKVGFRIQVKGGAVTVITARWPYMRVPVYINGMLSTSGELLNMPLSSSETIFYDQDTTDGGVFVSITLREGHYILPENRNKFVRTFITNGYARPHEYFSPIYSTTSRSFKEYGAIFWKGKLLVEKEVPSSLMVPLSNQKGLLLFIEGIAADGSLISLKKEIDLKTTN